MVLSNPPSPIRAPIPAIPIPPNPRVPLHEAIAQFRRFDGKTDVCEFLERFDSDLVYLGYDKQWAVRNIDRMLLGDAKSWWSSIWPQINREVNALGPNGDFDQLYTDVCDRFKTFFDHSSQKASYRQRNRDLNYKIGDDCQTYVSRKVELLRYIDPNMQPTRIVDQLTKGLPMEIRTSMVMQNIRTIDEFISKLRRVADLFHEMKVKPNHNSKSSSSQSVVMNQVTDVRRNQPTRYDGNCDYCHIYGHQWMTCRKLARENNLTLPPLPARNTLDNRGGRNPSSPQQQSSMPRPNPQTNRGGYRPRGRSYGNRRGGNNSPYNFRNNYSYGNSNPNSWQPQSADNLDMKVMHTVLHDDSQSLQNQSVPEN